MVDLKDTGERMIPEHHKGKNIYGSHVGRYVASAPFTKDKLVLDIACGSGYGTKIIAENSKTVIGVDVDSDTIEYAKKNFNASNIDYLVGDGVSIPVKDSTVDVVVSYETIEHIKDYNTFILEIKRVLKPGGIVIISTPNDTEYGEGNHFHYHEFTHSELTSLLKSYFLNVDEYYQTQWLYSSIVSKELQKTEWEKNVWTLNTTPLNEDQCIYFFMVCSDKDIVTDVKPIGVIGEHFRQRDEQKNAREKISYYENFKNLEKRFKSLEADYKKLKQKHRRSMKELEKMKKSKAWKLTRKMQKTAGIIKQVRKPKY